MPGPALPLLAPHRSSLETCVYCPKLCRGACPVSNVEASETVIPWGKMSTAYFELRGDVPMDRGHAATAWACTSCYACRDMCEHKNPVADVLMDARAEAFAKGVAPGPANELSARWFDRAAETTEAIDVLATQTDTDRSTLDDAALLIGCGYARHAPEVARDAVHATVALTSAKVRPVRACCGLPLLQAGDREGFLGAAKRLAAEVARAPKVIVVDPGCAQTLLVEYARAKVALPKVELFVDLAVQQKSRLRRLEGAELADDGAEHGHVRWHDPCQLGRGLGRFEEPRAVLDRVAPGARGFVRERSAGECSGGGGLLPITRPETSRAIAEQRIAEHRGAGGGVLVTHCAGSLRRFRTAGEAAMDLTTLVARALRSKGR